MTIGEKIHQDFGRKLKLKILSRADGMDLLHLFRRPTRLLALPLLRFGANPLRSGEYSADKCVFSTRVMCSCTVRTQGAAATFVAIFELKSI